LTLTPFIRSHNGKAIFATKIGKAI
jgi:hypothetical protein